MAFPIIPCNLCGSQENLQRRQVGEMLREWEKKHPGRIETHLQRAWATSSPTHLLDRALHDFAAVRATGQPDPGGDIAFDDDPCVPSSAQALRIHTL